MLTLRQPGAPLCDGLSRRDWLRIGGLGALGLGLPDLLGARRSLAASAPTAFGKAKSCIVLFMLGGPPQHETWDPKPDAPSEIRGDLRPIRTNVPGVWIGELMPRTAQLIDRIAVLRACRTADSAHSTSGYSMTTGVSHLPVGVEFARLGAPNDWPSIGAVVKHLRPPIGPLPASITLPDVLANDGNKTWPGQDAGFLGRTADPWVVGGDPAARAFQVPDLTLSPQTPEVRFDRRRRLLEDLDGAFARLDQRGATDRFSAWQQQAFDLLRSPSARRAFDLGLEPEAVRDRYGRNTFGQSLLLARRLVEAGVALVQVSWPRIPGALNNGHWDTHTKNSEALRNVLMPRMDQGYSALLEDLSSRGLLGETLVVWMGEFGRTPKINAAGGRDHWGNVFSLALAGGGVRGGVVHGESDRLGAEPVTGLVTPADFTATVFHCLGLSPGSEILDPSGRPHPISRGNVIREIL